MSTSVRKYRKSRDYSAVGTDAAAAYVVHDGTYSHDDDLLSSPDEFVPLSSLALGESSRLHVMLLLVVSSVGVSVVATPYAFLLGGFVMTLFMLLFLALASYVASVCIVQLGVAQGIYSLQGLAKLAFGQAGAHAVGITQLALSCGLVIAYLAIVFQDFPVLLGHELNLNFDAYGWPMESTTKYVTASKILADRTLFAELVGFIVVIPLCLLMYSYAKTRGAALFATVLLVLTSLCIVSQAKSFHEANVPIASQGYDRDYLVVPATVCQAFGILATQFASQHHVFHAFYAMRKRSVGGFVKVLALASLVGAYLMYSFGIGGYVAYLGTTKSDVTQNVDFTGDNRSLLPFWLLVPIAALLCIPFEVMSSRYAAVLLSRSRTFHSEQHAGLFGAQPAAQQQQYTSTSTGAIASTYESKMAGDDGLAHSTTMTRSRRSESYSRLQIALTFVALVILVQIVALTSHVHVAKVLSVTGGVAGIALILIVPAACVLKLGAPGDGSNSATDRSLFTTVLPWCSILVGVVASIACIISNIVHDE